MLSVLNTHRDMHTTMGTYAHTPKHTAKGPQETFGGDEYIYFLDCGEGNMSVYICLESLNFIQ